MEAAGRPSHHPRGTVENVPAYRGDGSYVMEYSEDNVKWTVVPAVAPVSGDFFDHKLNSVKARSLRLTLKAPAIPGKPVNISMFRVLSFDQGASTAVDARRLYGGPALLQNDASATTVKVAFENRTLWGSNQSGNLHIDADKTKVGGLIYMNWYDGKGVVFGNGAAATVASVDSSGNVNAKGTYQQDGMAFKGVVAGGTCLNGIGGLWDPQQSTYGGASCSGYSGTHGSTGSCPGNVGVAQVVCPTGTAKVVTFKMTNCSMGGEGAICVR